MFNYKILSNEKTYIFNTKNCGLIEMDVSQLYDEALKKYLVENSFWVDENLDEVTVLENELNEYNSQNVGSLDLTISLTRKCNFRCVYCYQEKIIKTMELPTAEKILEKVEQLINTKGYNGINIHYFGGEPLLNTDLLFFFHEMFLKISHQYNIPYKTYLTTNGSLLTIDIMKKINFDSIQLTFDGFAQRHNKLRKSNDFKSGVFV